MQRLARDSIRILHVDDDDDFTDLTSRSLRRAGFEQPVARCKDGLEAIDYFVKVEPGRAPHVVLLDLHVPGLNGMEVLHWVRQSYVERNIAVYILTSSEDPEHRRRAQADDVTEFLLKKSMTIELIHKLDAWIEARNAQLSRERIPVATSFSDTATGGESQVERIKLNDGDFSGSVML